MEDNGFREIMNLKSDGELLDILQYKRNDYQEKAIIDIENILKERGVKYEITIPQEQESKEHTTTTDEQNIYGPLVVGIILVLISLKTPTIESHDAVSINLTVNIIFRAIVLFWTYHLTEKFYLNKLLWMILGLVFGGWSLIAINVAIWFKDLKKESISNTDNTNPQNN